MGFRFRKSITIVPGIRLNLSNSTPSLSLGPRGASISIGERGTFANIGLGGGLSYRTRLDRTLTASNTSARQNAESKEQLRKSLLDSIELMEKSMQQVVNIHLLTPNPMLGLSMSELFDHYVKVVSRPYSISAPVRPPKPQIPPSPVKPTGEESAGFFKKFFESETEKIERMHTLHLKWECAMRDWEREKTLIEQRYLNSRVAWAEQHALWQTEANRHQEGIDSSLEQVNIRFATDTIFYEARLDEVLQNTDWPRDTSISYEVQPEQSIIRLDVDLPEIEDLPHSNLTLNRLGTEIIEKNMTQKVIRETYARHVHGILFRLIGIALYSLPFEKVCISGFTQRISKATGNLVDDYIIECTVDRSRFITLNFSSLEHIDPIEAISLFNPNRKMSSTFMFQPINLLNKW